MYTDQTNVYQQCSSQSVIEDKKIIITMCTLMNSIV